jgi:hypothetical protein
MPTVFRDVLVGVYISRNRDTNEGHPKNWHDSSNQPVSRMQCRVTRQLSRVDHELTDTKYKYFQKRRENTYTAGNRIGLVRLLPVLWQELRCTRSVYTSAKDFLPFFPCVTIDSLG